MRAENLHSYSCLKTWIPKSCVIPGDTVKDDEIRQHLGTLIDLEWINLPIMTQLIMVVSLGTNWSSLVLYRVKANSVLSIN